MEPPKQKHQTKTLHYEYSYNTKSKVPVWLRLIACTLIFSQVLMFASVILSPFIPVAAVAKTWVGLGADNNWSTAANWSPSGAPVAADTVTFNGTNTKDVIIDAGAAASVTSITIASGYTGTITLAKAFSVGTFTQSAGFFDAANQDFTITGNFTLNAGGEFTASSTNTAFRTNLIINGGVFNHNNGTIILNGSGTSQTLSCNNAEFNLVVVNKSSTSNSLTVNSNCNLPLGNNPTLTLGGNSSYFYLSGTLSGSGTLTFVQSNGGLTFNSTAVLDPAFTGFVANNALDFTTAMNMNFSSFSPFTINYSGSCGSSVTINSGGNLTLSPDGTFNFCNFTVNNGGSFTSTSGTLNLRGALTFNSGSTFYHNNGTIVINGAGTSQTLSCNNAEFNLVVVNKSSTSNSLTVNSNCNLPLGNNPTLTLGGNNSYFTLSGTLSGSGTLTFAHNYGGLTFNSTAVLDPAFTGFVANNASDFTTAMNMNFSSFSPFTINYSGSSCGTSVTINSGGNLTLSPDGTFNFCNFTVNNGGFFTSTSGTLNLRGALTFNSGSTFYHNNGTININGVSNGATLSCNNAEFNYVTINKTGNVSSLTVNSNCNLPLGNNPTLNLGNSNSHFTLSGTLSGSGTLTFTHYSGNLTFNSTAVLDPAFTGFVANNVSDFTTAINMNFSSFSPFTITYPTGCGTTVVINSGGDLALSPDGTFNFCNFTVNNGGSFTSTAGTLNVRGNLTLNSGSTFYHNNGTININGVSNGQTLSCNNAEFNYVTINKTGNVNNLTINTNCNLPVGNSPILNLGGTNSYLTLSGTLSGSGSLTFVLGAGDINLSSGFLLDGFTGLISNSTGSSLKVNATGNFSEYSPFIINGGLYLTAGTLTLPANVSVSLLNITGGTFNAPSENLNITGAFTVSGTPTFNHNNGTVTFNSGDATLNCNNSPNSVVFNRVSFTGQTGVKTVSSNCTLPLGENPIIPTSIILNGKLTGSGTLKMNAGTLTLNSTSSFEGLSGFDLVNLTVAGPTVDFEAYNTFTLSGTASVTSGSIKVPSGTSLNALAISSTGTFAKTTGNVSVGTLSMSAGTFNAPTGTLSISSTLNIAGGTFNHNDGIVNFTGGTATLTCGSASFNFVTFNNTGVKTVNSGCNFNIGENPVITNGITLSGILSGTGVVTMETGLLTLNAGYGFNGFSGLTGTTNSVTVNNSTVNWGSYNPLNIGGTFTITGASAAFTAPSGTMNIAGNFAHSQGTFTHNGGTVNLNGTSQTISGATTFNNLTKILPTEEAATLTFPANTTQVVAGTLTLHGFSQTARLALRSSSQGTRWIITPQGEVSLLYIDIRDGNNNSGNVIEMGGTGSSDSGNNTGFSFADLVPNNPSNLGPANVISAIIVPTTKPSFTFTLSDPNFLDTLRYNIQIDNDADFSSPVVNYTSALMARGTKTFTVGQAPGSGSYAPGQGSSGQSLTTGGYYWRVNATDNIGLSSAYSYGNAGEIAFYIDSEPPAAFTPELDVESPTTNRRPTVTFHTTDNVGVNYYQVRIDNGSFTTRTSPYQLPELTAGDHTITVRAYDTSNNFTDGVVVVTIIVHAPAPFTPQLNVTVPTNNQTPILSFETTDENGIDRYEVKIDSGSFTTRTSPYQLPTLAQGSHTITVRAYNIEGLYTDGVITFAVDITIPNAFTPQLNVGAYTTNTTPILTFTTNDPQTGINHYEVKIDDGSFTTRTSPYTLPTLAEGAHTITVRAFDNAGNYRDGTRNVTVDLTAPNNFTPEINVTSPTSNTTPTITFETIDNFVVASYQVKVDSGSFTTQISPYQLPALSAGDHQIIVRAIDAAGNSKEGTTIFISVDNNGPVAFTPILNPASPTNNQTPVLSFETTDDNGIDRYEVKIDSGSFNVQTSPYQLPTLLAGNHTVTVRAYDTLNNYTDAIINVIIDLTPPNAFSATLNTSATTNNTSPIVSFHTTDNVGVHHYEVKLDSGEYQTQTSPYQLPVLEMGTHTISVRAYDAAGNFRTSNTINLTIDVIQPDPFTPELNVTSPTINSTPTVTFSTDDNLAISHYRVKIDNGAFETRTSPYQVPPLSNGEHTITVRAYDTAGNFRESSVSVVIDRISPDPFTPTVQGGNPNNNAAPLLYFATTDAFGIDHYEVKINNGSFTTQTSPYQLPTLSETSYNQNPHTITVRAYNVLGATTDGVLNLRIDTTAPSLEYSAPRKYNNTDITTTTFSMSDNLGMQISNINVTGATLNCTQNQSRYISCKSTIVQSGTVTFSITDNAGNTSSVIIPGYVIEDVPPVITINAPTKTSPTTITDTTIVVTDNIYILADNVRAISGGTIMCLQTSQTRVDCTSSIADTGNLVINATDNAGNVVAKTESGYSVVATPPEPFEPYLNTTPFTNNTAPILFFSTTDVDGIDRYEVRIDDGEFTPQISPYQLPVQSAGFKTITVRAYDTQGNFRDGVVIVTIETSFPAPFTPILNVSNPTNNPTPEVSFFTTDPSSEIDRYEVSVDGGEFTVQESPYLLPELSEGDHSIVVRAYNLVENYTDGSVGITVDLTPPDSFTPVADPGPVSNTTTPQLIYSTTDNIEISHYEVQIDSGPFTPQESPYQVPTIPEGEHSMTVVAYDTAGNTTTETLAIEVDLSTPVISYIAPTKLSNQAITDTTITVIDETGILTSGVSAVGGSLDCTQTSVTQVDCTSVISASRNLEVTAVDQSGNTADEIITGYIIDTVPPVITITAPTKTSSVTITNTTVKVTDNIGINAASVNEIGGVISCTQTASTEVNCGVSISQSGQLTVSATDLAGNSSQATESGYNISVGTPDPFTPTLNTEFITSNTTPIVSFSTNDPSGINHYEVRVDDSQFSTQTSPYQLPALQEGFHSIIVRAFANSGNFRDGVVNVIIDLTSPSSVTINLDVESPTNNPQPIITFFAQDENGINYYEVKVESEHGEFSVQSSPYQIPPGLEDGDHTATVKAVDNAGNSLETTQDFVLDTVLPTGSIQINNGEAFTTDKIVVLDLEASDDRTGIESMMISEDSEFNQATYEPYSTSKQWTLSNKEGTKTIFVKFQDSAANESEVYSDSIGYYLSTSNIPVSDQSPSAVIEQIAEVLNNLIVNELPNTLIIATAITGAVNLAAYPKFIIYGFFLIRFRKKPKTWGIIYDKYTKKPIPFATARLYAANTNEFVTQRVTDTEGRYGFVINKGSYILEIKQSGYVPYKENIEYNTNEGIVAKDIGLVPEVSSAQTFRLNLRSKLYTLNTILVYAGFTLSIVALIVSQTLLNVVIVALYAAQFIIFRLLSKKTKREWGYVYNSKNGAKIKGAFVRIYDTVLTRQVEVIITDEQGRYMFNNLKEGNYLISVYSEGYTFPAQSQSNLNLTYSQTGQAFVKVSVLKGKPINLIIPLDPLSPSAVRSGPFGS